MTDVAVKQEKAGVAGAAGIGIAATDQSALGSFSPSEQRKTEVQVRVDDQRLEQMLYSEAWGPAIAAAVIKSAANAGVDPRRIHQAQEEARALEGPTAKRKKASSSSLDEWTLQTLLTTLGPTAAEKVIAAIDKFASAVGDNSATPQSVARLTEELSKALAGNDTLLRLHLTTKEVEAILPNGDLSRAGLLAMVSSTVQAAADEQEQNRSRPFDSSVNSPGREEVSRNADRQLAELSETRKKVFLDASFVSILASEEDTRQSQVVQSETQLLYAQRAVGALLRVQTLGESGVPLDKGKVSEQIARRLGHAPGASLDEISRKLQSTSELTGDDLVQGLFAAGAITDAEKVQILSTDGIQSRAILEEKQGFALEISKALLAYEKALGIVAATKLALSEVTAEKIAYTEQLQSSVALDASLRTKSVEQLVSETKNSLSRIQEEVARATGQRREELIATRDAIEWGLVEHRVQRLTSRHPPELGAAAKIITSFLATGGVDVPPRSVAFERRALDARGILTTVDQCSAELKSGRDRIANMSPAARERESQAQVEYKRLQADAGDYWIRPTYEKVKAAEDFKKNELLPSKTLVAQIDKSIVHLDSVMIPDLEVALLHTLDPRLLPPTHVASGHTKEAWQRLNSFCTETVAEGQMLPLVNTLREVLTPLALRVGTPKTAVTDIASALDVTKAVNIPEILLKDQPKVSEFVKGKGAEIERRLQGTASELEKSEALQKLRRVASRSEPVGVALSKIPVNISSDTQLSYLGAVLPEREKGRVTLFLAAHDTRQGIAQILGLPEAQSDSELWAQISSMDEANLTPVTAHFTLFANSFQIHRIIESLPVEGRREVLRKYEDRFGVSLGGAILSRAEALTDPRTILTHFASLRVIANSDLAPYLPQGINLPGNLLARRLAVDEARRLQVAKPSQALDSRLEELYKKEGTLNIAYRVALNTSDTALASEISREIRLLQETKLQYTSVAARAEGSPESGRRLRATYPVAGYHQSAQQEMQWAIEKSQKGIQELTDRFVRTGGEPRILVDTMRTLSPSKEEGYLLRAAYLQNVGRTLESDVSKPSKNESGPLNQQRLLAILSGGKDSLAQCDRLALEAGVLRGDSSLVVEGLKNFAQKGDLASTLARATEANPALLQKVRDMARVATPAGSELKEYLAALERDDKVVKSIIEFKNGVIGRGKEVGEVVSFLADLRITHGAAEVNRGAELWKTLYGKSIVEDLLGAKAPPSLHQALTYLVNGKESGSRDAAPKLVKYVCEHGEAANIASLLSVVTRLGVSSQELGRVLDSWVEEGTYARYLTASGEKGKNRALLFDAWVKGVLSSEAFANGLVNLSRAENHLASLVVLRAGYGEVNDKAKEILKAAEEQKVAALRDQNDRIWNRGLARDVTATHARFVSSQTNLVQNQNQALRAADLAIAEAQLTMRLFARDISSKGISLIDVDQSVAGTANRARVSIASVEWAAVREVDFYRWQRESTLASEKLKYWDGWVDFGATAVKVAVVIGVSVAFGPWAGLGVALLWNGTDKGIRVYLGQMSLSGALTSFAIEAALDLVVAGLSAVKLFANPALRLTLGKTVVAGGGKEVTTTSLSTVSKFLEQRVTGYAGELVKVQTAKAGWFGAVRESVVQFFSPKRAVEVAAKAVTETSENVFQRFGVNALVGRGAGLESLFGLLGNTAIALTSRGNDHQLHTVPGQTPGNGISAGGMPLSPILVVVEPVPVTPSPQTGAATLSATTNNASALQTVDPTVAQSLFDIQRAVEDVLKRLEALLTKALSQGGEPPVVPPPIGPAAGNAAGSTPSSGSGGSSGGSDDKKGGGAASGGVAGPSPVLVDKDNNTPAQPTGNNKTEPPAVVPTQQIPEDVKLVLGLADQEVFGISPTSYTTTAAPSPGAIAFSGPIEVTPLGINYTQVAPNRPPAVIADPAIAALTAYSESLVAHEQGQRARQVMSMQEGERLTVLTEEAISLKVAESQKAALLIAEGQKVGSLLEQQRQSEAREVSELQKEALRVAELTTMGNRLEQQRQTEALAQAHTQMQAAQNSSQANAYALANGHGAASPLKEGQTEATPHGLTSRIADAIRADQNVASGTMFAADAEQAALRSANGFSTDSRDIVPQGAAVTAGFLARSSVLDDERRALATAALQPQKGREDELLLHAKPLVAAQDREALLSALSDSGMSTRGGRYTGDRESELRNAALISATNERQEASRIGSASVVGQGGIAGELSADKNSQGNLAHLPGTSVAESARDQAMGVSSLTGASTDRELSAEYAQLVASINEQILLHRESLRIAVALEAEEAASSEEGEKRDVAKRMAKRKRAERQLRADERLREFLLHQLRTRYFAEIERNKLLALLQRLGISEVEYRALVASLGELEAQRVAAGERAYAQPLMNEVGEGEEPEHDTTPPRGHESGTEVAEGPLNADKSKSPPPVSPPGHVVSRRVSRGEVFAKLREGSGGAES